MLACALALVASPSWLPQEPLPDPAPAEPTGAAQEAGAAVHPIELDRTGVRWARSFEEALTGATQQRRLLLVLPDDAEPSASGSFGRAMEVFRAGPLCDERVVRLINLRYVPYYFNVYTGTPAHDPQALAFVTKVRPVYGETNQTFRRGMPILVLSAAGELLAEVSSFEQPDMVVQILLRVLEKNRKYAGFSDSEREEEDAMARARLYLALGDPKKAVSSLRKLDSAEGHLLLAQIARELQDWRNFEKHLEQVDDPGLAGHVAVEEALHALLQQDFAGMLQRLAPVGAESAAYDQARYLLGVALYRSGDPELALETWTELIESRPQGPWAYRADWAYCNAKQGPWRGRRGGGAEESPSLLGRAGYLGPRNPDLGGRSRR